jgi:hypothetical protein
LYWDSFAVPFNLLSEQLVASQEGLTAFIAFTDYLCLGFGGLA